MGTDRTNKKGTYHINKYSRSTFWPVKTEETPRDLRLKFWVRVQPWQGRYSNDPLRLKYNATSNQTAGLKVASWAYTDCEFGKLSARNASKTKRADQLQEARS
jgi:hypothetical protein